MLRSLKEPTGYVLSAREGEIGRVPSVIWITPVGGVVDSSFDGARSIGYADRGCSLH